MALTNVTTFNAGLKKFGTLARETKNKRVRAVALRIFSGAVQGTRFDTGRLKGNWQVGEGSPPSGTVEREDPNGTETLSEGARKIQGMSGEDVIWLHNGLPYAVVWEKEDKMLAGNVEAVRTWLEST